MNEQNINVQDTNMYDKIIEAAKARFRHYGYFKTTIAEIAKDCDMSPGNLYRYFDSKIDIAATIARAESLNQVDNLRSFVESTDQPASQRLKALMLQELRETFHKLENNKKLVELIQFVIQEQPRFLAESLRRERRVLAIILDHGRQSGEMRVDDVNKVASSLQAAMMKFRYPQLFTHQTLEDLENELTILLDILFDGLMNAENMA
ncbi:MAG: TetR/AcrR family transcriptional regulator [Alphaproteobacteria bacterium]|nr:TetR/AcrR family transcriptional regulator [Alphaproteobacteria bacterium]